MDFARLPTVLPARSAGVTASELAVRSNSLRLNPAESGIGDMISPANHAKLEMICPFGKDDHVAVNRLEDICQLIADSFYIARFWGLRLRWPSPKAAPQN